MVRIFVYDSRELPDPNPTMSVDEVRQYYVTWFQELSNATTEKEVKRGEDMVHEFKKRVGTKGQVAEPIVFKCESAMWGWLDDEGVTGIPAKPVDVRRWDLSDDRIYRLSWYKGIQIGPPTHQVTLGRVQSLLKPEVESITFLNKVTGETLTRQYLGMEFTRWAPGFVFLLLGERV